MRKPFLGCVLVLVWLLVLAPLFAQEDASQAPEDVSVDELAATAPERILFYHSDITVYRDASMLVRETIKVRSSGEQIRHGIYRDLPTRYHDKYGNAYRVGFEIQEILRDGRAEDYHTEGLENGVRVYIGSKDVLLQPGEYTYTLAYRTHRQLGFFRDHDELYWNVTGNGWAFAIDQASATVTLPAGVGRDDLRLEGYTGDQGSTEKNFAAEVTPEGKAHFATTRMLGSNQGLTIVVSFPKGVIPEPTREQKITWFLADNRPALAAALGLLIVLGYYVVIWTRVGRDPDPGSIMPLYEPPQNLSPAGMRHLVRMGFDDKTFAAAVLDIAVKKGLTISQDGGDYSLSRLDADRVVLAPEERTVTSSLFGSSKTIELKTQNHVTIRSAIEALKESLKNGQEKVYFLTNKRYLVPGLLLSALTLLAQLVAAEGVERKMLAGFMTIWLTGWSFGVFFLILTAFRAWKGVLFGGVVNRALSLVGALFVTAFALPFLAGEGFGIYMYSTATSPAAVAVLLTMVGVNVLFHYLLKAPTSAGRTLLDKVEGFKMFLTAVDSDRLRRFEGPARTPELFERFLPYALALDCEQQWADQFADVLAQAAQAGQSSYSPAWYRGTNWNAFNPGGFASSFGSSFSSAVSSSSTAPGSSSGSSGGGSSGGGGGGGGGGGW